MHRADFRAHKYHWSAGKLYDVRYKGSIRLDSVGSYHASKLYEIDNEMYKKRTGYEA